MVCITIKSVIAGIHRTKVGSNPKIELNVEADDSIPGIDPLCMLVRIPRKEQLPQEYLHLVTYPKSCNPNNKRNKDQLAYEVVGKKVGNVPTGLCGLFRQLKSSGKVRKISCYSVGERPLPSTSPPTKQKFSRQQSRCGGGLVLECVYQLEVANGVTGVIDEVKAVVQSMEGMETVVDA